MFRFLDNEFKKFRQIAVMGIKKPKSDGSDKVEKLVQAASDIEHMPPITDLKPSVIYSPEREKERRVI